MRGAFGFTQGDGNDLHIGIGGQHAFGKFLVLLALQTARFDIDIDMNVESAFWQSSSLAIQTSVNFASSGITSAAVLPHFQRFLR